MILTGVLDLPSREDDAYDSLYETAARLQQAGVRFCISTGNTGSNVRDLPYHAGMAAAFGLPRAEALKAVLNDKSKDVRSQAAWALSVIGELGKN